MRTQTDAHRYNSIIFPSVGWLSARSILRFAPMNLRFCRWPLPIQLLTFAVFSVAAAHAAGPAPFDLKGPSLEVTVARGDTTLPIARVPHLAERDKLSIKADFPQTQSEHYLLIVSFLRGPTNPPPKNWYEPDHAAVVKPRAPTRPLMPMARTEIVTLRA